MRKRTKGLVLLACLMAGIMLLGFAGSSRAGDIPPSPIDPSTGEAALLEVVNAIPINEIDKALDNFPVPYVVVASAGGAAPTIKSNRAGAPTKIDADRSLLTGKGGNDLQVEVNTELTPTRHLRLTITRQGTAPFANDVSVLIAFPFDAFNDEDATLAGDPNLFFGYQTTAALNATTGEYAEGGVAPQTLEYRFDPGSLDFRDHTLGMNIATTGAANPVRYLAGAFDGNAEQGVQNAFGAAAHVDPVPAMANISLGVDETPTSLDPAALTDSSLNLAWTASAPARVELDYLENESFPFTVPDFNSTLTFDQMPVSETLSLRLNEGDDGINGLALTHTGSAPINEITFLKERDDGLMIRGVASQVPTQVTLGADLDGGVSLDVNANTMDLSVDVTQMGGFFDTDGFLGYDVGLLHFGATDVPDLTATFDPANDRYIANATNPLESIGAIDLVLDDGPVPVIGGSVDSSRDGSIGADDDGPFGSFTLIDGKVDANLDGVINGDDDSESLAGAVPESPVIDGQLDLDRDGVIGSADSAGVSALALPPAWTEEEEHHVLSLADDGGTGTVAGRLVNVSGGQLDLDGQPVIDGAVDLDMNGAIDAADDGVILLNLDVIDGKLDLNDDGAITATDDGKLYKTVGAVVIDGALDMNNDGAINGDDDGALNSTVFGMGTTAPAPLQGFLNTKSGSTIFPGRDVSAVCTVEDVPAGNVRFDFGMPPPVLAMAATLPQGATVDKMSCIGHAGTLLFETELGGVPAGLAFEFLPDQALNVLAHDGSTPIVPNSARLGSGKAHFCDDPNLDGVCDSDDSGGTGIPATANLFGSALFDAWARIDDTPSFEGRWRQGSLTVTDGRVTSPDTSWGGVNLIGGLVDVNDDSLITPADDGRFIGKRVTDGLIDLDDDGVGTAADDGTVSGTAIGYDTGSPDITSHIDGVQVAVSTERGLAEPAVADPAADHYADFIDEGTDAAKTLRAGAFGIDELAYGSDDANRGIGLRYGANQAHKLIASFDSAFGGKYFPGNDVDLTLTIDQVPGTFTAFTDLATELDYVASAAISKVRLDGVIDDTNDGTANGTNVDLQLDGLPNRLAWYLAGSVTGVADGTLDVGNKVVAGTRFIGGRADLTGDGLVNAADDGFFLGIPVIDGGIDATEDGTVNGDDDGAVAGSTLDMAAPITKISLQADSDNKVIKTDYRQVDVSITNVPAKWAVNWGGGRFLIESKDAVGNRAPMGVVSAVVSTSNDATENANRLNPFTLDGTTLSGPVLNATGGAASCRINYSEFAQKIDQNYFTASASTNVLDRLRELYCDAEKLDANEDHALVRMGTVNGKKAVEYGSLQFSSFQRVSFTPDADGGKFILRAPVAGLHPLYAGYEEDDKFTTLQVGNIPDEVIVDIDKTEHVTYDATDDVNASFGEIDIYSGPLPLASDADDATRVVVQPRPGATDSDPTHSYIHTGWNLGFPSGGAFLDNSEELEVLLLTQDGDYRVTAGLALEDLLAGYAFDLFSFDTTDTLCIIPDPFGGCIVEIPVAWELFEAKAGIVNKADGFTPASLTSMTPDTLSPDLAKPDVAGFLNIYTHETQADLQAIEGGPSPGSGGEFVPMITAAEEGFRGLTASARLSLDPLSAQFLVFSFDVDLDVTATDFLFDFWTTENIDFTDDDAIPFIDEVGFVNKPDYVDNKPFHILPGLNPLNPVENADFENVRDLIYTFNGWHGYDDHFDPFD